MKRLFKLAMVFVLSGAALLNVGCTKDYGEEIASVKKDLENLKTGTVADHTTQIAAIELTIKDLQAMDETLQKEIDALAEAIQKIPTDTAIVNLRNRVTELEKCSEANKKDIATLQGLVADKADKSWVELTFATKDALGQVAEDLGKLTTTVSDIDAAYKKADGVLQGQIDQIKEDITTLQGKVENLELAIADRYTKGEVDGLIQGVKLDLADMEKKLQENIDAEAKARKEGDEALAETIENEVKKLQGQIDEIKNTIVPALEKADEELEAKILEVEKNLGIELLARMSGDKALNDSIDVVVKMYQDADGILQQQITNLEQAKTAGDDSLNVKINEEINARIAAIKDTKEDLEAFVTKLVGISDTSKGSIKDMLDEEIETRSNEIQRLEDLINEMSETTVPGLVLKVKEIEGNIAALSGRVSSLSVYPTLTSEVINFQLDGKDVVNMMRVSFEVEPATMAKTIAENKSKLALNYCAALERSNTKKIETTPEMKQATIDTILYDNLKGVVTVIAGGVEPKTSKFYSYQFSATWADTDKAGSYTVTSDYAQAVESGTEVELLGSFKYAYDSDTTNIRFVGKDSLVNESTRDFIAAATDTIKPFAGKMVAFDNSEYPKFLRLFLDKDAYTVYELGKVLGHEFEVTAFKDYPTPPVCGYSAEGYGLFDVDFYFYAGKGEELRDYVQKDPHDIYFYAMVDGKKLRDANGDPCALTHNAYITMVDKGTFDLGTATIRWNYKTYYKKDRKIDFSPAVQAWEDAKTALCKVMKKLGNSEAIIYGDWDGSDSTKSYYPIKLSLDVNNYDSTATYQAVQDTIIKQNDTVKFTFPFETVIEKPMSDVTETLDTIKVDGSFTKQIEVTVENIDSLFICKDGAIKPALISGLTGDDTKFENIKSAFDSHIIEKNVVLMVDGAINIKKYSYQYDNATGNLKITIIAGEWGYNAKHLCNITIHDIFGIKYNLVIPVKTGGPKFSIVTRAMIVDSVGTVRGAIKDYSGTDVFTIEDLHFNQQVQLKDLDKANEIEGTEYYVKFTCDTVTPGATGYPAITSDRIKVDPTTGTLADDTMTWGTYNGLKLKMKAELWVNKDKVNGVDPTSYYLQTDKPVELVDNGKIEETKYPATDLEIPVYQNLKVYGMVNGSIDKTKEIMTKGKNVNPLYGTKDNAVGATDNGGKTEFVYGETSEFTFVLNGKTVTLVKGTDYEWDKETGMFTVKMDNLKGALTVTIPVTLNYYLDVNHTKAEKKTITIEVKQN